MAGSEQREVAAGGGRLEAVCKRLDRIRIQTRASAAKRTSTGSFPAAAASSAFRAAWARSGSSNNASSSGAIFCSAPHSCSISSIRDGRAFHEPAREFLPHALRNERVDLSVRHHLAHERFGFGRDVEPEARGEAREPEDAHRVLAEGRAHVTQQTCAQVIGAIERIDEVAVLVARDRVDREIAAREVLLERHVGRRVELEAVIAAAGLAAGQVRGAKLATTRRNASLAFRDEEKRRENLSDGR